MRVARLGGRSGRAILWLVVLEDGVTNAVAVDPKVPAAVRASMPPSRVHPVAGSDVACAVAAQALTAVQSLLLCRPMALLRVLGDRQLVVGADRRGLYRSRSSASVQTAPAWF